MRGALTAKPGANSQGERVLHLAFAGSSMAPVLEPDDILEVLPYGRKAIRPGDVIFFTDVSGGAAVVHRVLAVSARGIRTRGDNNVDEDRGWVEREHVLGRVIAARRGRRRRRIAGGREGLLVAALCRVRRRVLPPLRPLARLPGKWLAGAGVGLPSVLQPRLVSFAGPSGEHWRLLVGSHVIATFRPRARAWQVRLPYRLFLDPAHLPIPGDRADPR